MVEKTIEDKIRASGECGRFSVCFACAGSAGSLLDCSGAFLGRSELYKLGYDVAYH